MYSFEQTSPVGIFKEVSKEREMERDNGLRANLSSARHDAVSGKAWLRPYPGGFKLRDMITDKSILKSVTRMLLGLSLLSELGR